MGTKLLNRDAILGASDLTTEDVPVPEWGGTVRVKALNGMERDDYEAGLASQRKDGSIEVTLRNARARLASLAIVDEAGARVFTDDDVLLLSTKSAAALDRVFEAASRLAGLGDKDLEELTGNSGATASAGSRTA